MAIRQITTPNLDMPAKSGWCLKYVDDTVNAPLRQPNATASFNVENANGNIRNSEFPVGVWVPGYLELGKEPLGHVFMAFNHGDGNVEIHDSEVHSGKRQPYHSIPELFAWFRNYAPSLRGWSYWIDGVQMIEDYEEPTPPPAPEPTPEPTPVPTPEPTTVNIGDAVTTVATEDVQNGETLNLDIINDGQSIFTEINSRGNAVLRVADGTVRAAVSVDSLRKI